MILNILPLGPMSESYKGAGNDQAHPTKSSQKDYMMSTKSDLLRSLALVLGFAVLAGTSAARPALQDDAVLTEGLINTAIAYEIGRKCDRLDARILRGINFLYGLKAHAESLGYSTSEIEAYVDDDAEKERLEAIARQRLRDLGGVPGEWESYCLVGEGQIAAGTQIGRLLR